MSPELSKYDWLSAALLADNGARAMDAAVKPLVSKWKMFGKALTVSVPEGDNLAVHAALSIIKPGQVLVVDAGGYPNRAIMGGLMARQAKAQGVAGVIINGAMRDVEELSILGLPMFCIATHPAGPTKTGGGSVGQVITCCGVHVATGDWILADADGVAVFSDADFHVIVGKANEKLQREKKRIDAIEAGELVPAWLEQAFAEADKPVNISV